MSLKKRLLARLRGRVEEELRQAEVAGGAALSLTRDGDLKSDGKYDTRGIEAGQLAGAQMRRVEELRQELQLLEETPARDYGPDDEIALGALVELEHQGRARRYFLCTTGGGTLLDEGDGAVLVITVFSPLGEAVLGLGAGDEFEVETSSETRSYRITSVS